MSDALTAAEGPRSTASSCDEVQVTNGGSNGDLSAESPASAGGESTLSAVSGCGEAAPNPKQPDPQEPAVEEPPLHEHPAPSQPADAASRDSGFVESCPSLASVEQQEPHAGGLLPYVNFCAQYAHQVATWCGRGQASNDISEANPPPLCDSKRELVQQWLRRPARRQVLESEVQNFSHSEGQNEYNIWYGRHLTDRHNRPSHLDREAAPYRCNPELDAGYTAADTQPGNAEAYFCAFFAKGCCTKGSECRYKHRIPTLEDESTLEWSRDIFGRERHRDHRDDMGGAGSFNHECRTLFVGGLQIDPLEEDGLRSLEKFLWEAFGAWGDVQEVRVIPKKLIGFVTFAYRVQAEFAKVAMADQNFGKHGSLLSVKWAHQDGNAKRKNAGDEQQSKKPKVGAGDEPAAPQKPQEQREEALVRQTLESYCSAWQSYWASCVGEKDMQEKALPHADTTSASPNRILKDCSHATEQPPSVSVYGDSVPHQWSREPGHHVYGA
ncbi:hypothetical protein Efla_001742 [Eimeria flavescens]